METKNIGKYIVMENGNDIFLEIKGVQPIIRIPKDVLMPSTLKMWQMANRESHVREFLKDYIFSLHCRADNVEKLLLELFKSFGHDFKLS